MGTGCPPSSGFLFFLLANQLLSNEDPTDCLEPLLSLSQTVTLAYVVLEPERVLLS